MQSFYAFKCSGFSKGKHRRLSIFTHFHSTTLHLYKKMVTAVSNMQYFNCLSYEMVQHKLNGELTNIIQACYVTHCKIKSNIYNSGIIHLRYKKKGFYCQNLNSLKVPQFQFYRHFVNLGIIILFVLTG